MWKKTLFLIAAGAIATCASAQKASENTADCPDAWNMNARQLQGQWLARFADGGTAVLQLGPHPEWQAMVRGTVTLGHPGGPHIAMVGDVNDGQLTLEESENGTNISATWLGEVVEGRCAREIQGERLDADDSRPPRPFVLLRQP